mmetsp:Transcript_35617/g.80457  ORF Transcript_35617/g.80457 Transcript_35617/m.80457 type:complete len:215 (+) Transcript_35617:48-692(+)
MCTELGALGTTAASRAGFSSSSIIEQRSCQQAMTAHLISSRTTAMESHNPTRTLSALSSSWSRPSSGVGCMTARASSRGRFASPWSREASPVAIKVPSRDDTDATITFRGRRLPMRLQAAMAPMMKREEATNAPTGTLPSLPRCTVLSHSFATVTPRPAAASRLPAKVAIRLSLMQHSAKPAKARTTSHTSRGRKSHCGRSGPSLCRLSVVSPA